MKTIEVPTGHGPCPLLGPGYLRGMAVALEGLIDKYDLEYNTTRMYRIALNRLAYWLEDAGEMLTYDAVKRYNDELGHTCSERSARSKRLQIRAALRLLQQLGRVPYDFSDYLLPMSETPIIELPLCFDEAMTQLAGTLEAQVYERVCEYSEEHFCDVDILQACAYIEMQYVYLLPGMLVEGLHSVGVGKNEVHVLPSTPALKAMVECPCLERYMEKRDVRKAVFFDGGMTLMQRVHGMLSSLSQRERYTSHQFVKHRTEQVLNCGLPSSYLSKTVYLDSVSLYRLSQRDFELESRSGGKVSI